MDRDHLPGCLYDSGGICRCDQIERERKEMAGDAAYHSEKER